MDTILPERKSGSWVVIAIALAWLCAMPVCAQQLSLRRYDTSDGLAHSVVTSIYQDKKGYLWFSTFEGLSRFDGYRFTNYDTRDGLSHSIINHVTEDRNGRLWVATNGGGVARLQDEPPGAAAARSAHTGKFVSFSVGDTPESNSVNRILFDSQDNFWCLTDFGVYRARATDSDLKFETVTPQVSRNSDALLEDRKGRLWFCVAGNPGLLSDLIEVNRNQVINHGPVGGVRGNPITEVIEDQQGRLLVASYLGVHEFVPPQTLGGRGEWRRLPLTLNTKQLINVLLESSTGALWLGTSGGLIKYQNGQQTEYTIAHGLSGNVVRSLAEDRDGNLWIGTAGAGVSKLSGEMFISFTPAEGLPNPLVHAVFEDRHGQIKALLPDYALAEIISGKVSPLRGLDQPPVSTESFLIQLEAPTAWWWASDNGAWARISKPVLRLRSGREIDLTDFGPFKVLPTSFAFYEDETGKLWFSKAEGRRTQGDGRIYRADPARSGPPVSESFPSGFTWAGATGMLMISDRAGGLWLGRQEMLGRLWQGRFIRMQPTEGLPETDPRCFFLDSRGWLWIGMRYGGVSMTKEPGTENPQFVNYSTGQGLSSSAVRSITEDNAGKLYFGTDRGLDQLDPNTNRWRHYTRKDGLAGDNVAHLHKDLRGNIWISTSLGISKLDPRAEGTAVGPAPIYFSRVNVAGEDLPLHETGAAQIPQIELAAARNSLLIEFVALSFQGEDRLTYQYQLEGIDADWSAPARSRSVNYARLAPGSYRFLARAVNADGVLSEAPASFSFTILPPIWQRWWFITIVGTLVGLVAYSLYRFRVARLIELERVRTHIAADLHDDIGSSLSQIAVLSEVLRKQLGAQEARVSKNLSLINRVSQEALDSMSDIVWAINPQQDHLSDLVRRMRRVASEMLPARNIEFTFNAPTGGHDLKLGADIRRQLFLMFKETINNIIRHSECTRAEIEMKVEGPWLRLVIADNGKGFDADRASEGNGLVSLRRRARAHGGETVVSSRKGEGTTVTVKFPHSHPLLFGGGDGKRAGNGATKE